MLATASAPAVVAPAVETCDWKRVFRIKNGFDASAAKKPETPANTSDCSHFANGEVSGAMRFFDEA